MTSSATREPTCFFTESVGLAALRVGSSAPEVRLRGAQVLTRSRDESSELLGGVDPQVGVHDVEHDLVRNERLRGAVRRVGAEGRHRAVRVPAERVHVSVRVGGGGEPEARRGKRRLLDPGVVRGVVLQGRVRRGLRLRAVVPVRFAADNHDGAVGKSRRRLVADGDRHGRLVGPGGGAAGDVELEDVFRELVQVREGPGGVVEAADGVALAAGGGAGDVAARLGQRRRGGPGGRRRGRVQDLNGVERGQKVGVSADGVHLGAHGERAEVRSAGVQLGPDGPRVGGGVVDEGGVRRLDVGCVHVAEGIVDGESADDVNLGADGGGAVAHASDGQRSLGAVVVVDDRIVLANNSHAGAVDVLAADQVDLVADGDGDEVGSRRGQIFFGGPRARALEERARGGVAFERRGLADANHDGLRLDGIVGVEADVHHERERGR
mmetsp:Transcript_8754/g.36960  ORF Transcript_8754/g.36960 Transcript_8754/m.36960 type:complete len:437 (+) Transcript_8754:3054-4364(+)